MDADGEFVVVWEAQDPADGTWNVFARRFDSAGSPLDPAEFAVNTMTTGSQLASSVGTDGSGARSEEGIGGRESCATAGGGCRSCRSGA